MTELGPSTDVSALLQVLLDKGNAYNTGGTVSQKELYQAAKELANALQPPFERVAQLAMHEVLRKSPDFICTLLDTHYSSQQSARPSVSAFSLNSLTRWLKPNHRRRWMSLRK